MRLRAVPDPAAPSGGFGYLVADGTDISEASVSVQVCDAYSGRWLGAPSDQGLISVDDGTWQSEPHTFGPYTAQTQGSEIWIRIGPEIVNKIGEYTPLRITIEGQTADLVWPDDILPRIAQALVGEIRSTATPSPETARPRTVVAEEVVEDDPPTENPAEVLDDEEETPRRSWLIWVLLFAVLTAVAAFYLWPMEEAEQSTGIAYEPDTETPPANPCSHASIAEKGGGYLAMEAAVRDCGAKISANEAIRLLEMGVREGSPDALVLFGKIYDVQQKDDLIETTVGLTFEDDPATAAELLPRLNLEQDIEVCIGFVIKVRMTKTTVDKDALIPACTNNGALSIMLARQGYIDEA